MTIIAGKDLDLLFCPFPEIAATKMLADAFTTVWKTRRASQRRVAVVYLRADGQKSV